MSNFINHSTSAVVALLVLAACGGNRDDPPDSPPPPPPPPPSTYVIGGSVNGLAGTGLVLINNGGETYQVTADGAFAFPTSVVTGTAYDIRVLTQPSGPVQRCFASANRGTVANAAVTAPSIACVTQTPRFAVGIDFLDRSLSLYAVDAATGQLRPRGEVRTGLHPVDFATDASGRFWYVLNRGSQTISVYTFDASTGAVLEVPGSPYPSGTPEVLDEFYPPGNMALIAHPRLNYLYVATGLFGRELSIRALAVDRANGALTDIPGGPFAAGEGRLKLSIDDGGRFAYAVNEFSREIYSYTIDQASGALAEIANGRVATGFTPDALVLHPNGKFAYLTDHYDGTLAAFSIDAITGALRAVVGSPFAVAGRPDASVVFHPGGRFLYIVRSAPNQSQQSALDAFAIDQTTGALTPLGSSTLFGAPVSAWLGSSGLQMDRTGKFIVAGSRGRLEVFGADANTGVLAKVGEGVLDGFANSFSFDVSGKFVYVTGQVNDSHHGFTFDTATGALTPLARGVAMVGRFQPRWLEQLASVAATPPILFRSKFAYLPDSADGTISAFAVDSASGAWTSINGISSRTVFTDGVQAVAIQPRGRWLLAVNDATNSFISSYAIDAGGGLSAAVDSRAVGTNPVAVVFHPNGRTAYVANRGNNTLQAFRLADTGLITPLATITTPAAPVALQLSPNGRYLYFLTTTSWGLCRVALDGSLPSIAKFVTEGLSPKAALAIHPSGRFAYLSILGNPGAIEMYGISPPFNLRDVNPYLGGDLYAIHSAVATGSDPTAIAIDPTGEYLYAANGSGSGADVAMFRINQQPALATNRMGDLTPLGSSMSSGNQPVSLRVDYTGRYLYAISRLRKQALAYSVDAASGSLTPLAAAPVATGNVPMQLSLSEDIE
jgi:6-phosphogluconolactonase (cycloisomerase 2 family)